MRHRDIIKGTLKVDFMNGTCLLNQDIGALPKVIGRNVLSMRHGKTLIRAGRKGIFKVLTGKHSLFEGNERLIRLFYESILLDKPIPVTHENGLYSMEVMDKIWQQIEF